jgi:hypothetical protein
MYDMAVQLNLYLLGHSSLYVPNALSLSKDQLATQWFLSASRYQNNFQKTPSKVYRCKYGRMSCIFSNTYLVSYRWYEMLLFYCKTLSWICYIYWMMQNIRNATSLTGTVYVIIVSEFSSGFNMVLIG